MHGYLEVTFDSYDENFITWNEMHKQNSKERLHKIRDKLAAQV